MSISMVLDKWTQHVHTTEWSTDVKANDKAFFVAMVYISAKQESYREYASHVKGTHILTYTHTTNIHSFSQN